jgi:hypothetical protein
MLGVRARHEAILQCLEIFRWTSQYGQKARSTRGKMVLCVGERPERLSSANPLHRQVSGRHGISLVWGMPCLPI